MKYHRSTGATRGYRISSDAKFSAVDHRAWTSCGVELSPRMSVEDALDAAGLNWTVARKPLRYDHEGTDVEMPKISALVSSEGELMGPLGPTYEPVQNSEVFQTFWEFSREYGIRPEAAGRLKEKKGLPYVWILGSSDHVYDEGSDRIRAKILVAHPHAWGKSTQIRSVVWRETGESAITALVERKRHRNSLATRAPLIEHLRKSWEGVKDDFGLAATRMTRLSDRRTDFASLARFVADVFQPELIENRRQPKIEEFDVMSMRAFEAITRSPGAKLPSSRGTWWGAVAGIAYAVDHLTWWNREMALHDAWVGSSSALKRRAWDLAEEYSEGLR